MRFRYKAVLIAIVLSSVFLWGRCSHRPKQKSPMVLPPNDTEQITVNPDTHQLIILGPRSRTVETLPDRPSTFDIHPNGTVTVTSKQLGLEHHLFVAAMGSEHLRLGVGADLWYFKRMDLGVGIADQVGPYTPVVFAKATYNVKGNLQMGLVYQSNKYLGGILAVRVF